MKTIPLQTLRSSKWFKPALIAAGALLVLLVALLALPYLIDINTYRAQIAGQVEQTLGRTVKLGKMDLDVLPSVKVNVDEVQIGDDPQFAQSDFVTAKSVRLQIGLWSLLRGNPQLQGIELVEPAITLIKTPDSKWNWSTLKPLQSAESDASQAPFNLVVRDGRFTLIDRNADPPIEKSYTGVNVALDGFSPRQAFDLAIGVTMPGEKAGTVTIEGEAGPIDRADAARTPIDARVRMDGVELAALESLLGVAAPHAGRLTMDVKLSGKLAEGLKAAGNLKAEQLRLVENVEPARTPLETDFTLSAKSEPRATEQAELSLAIAQCQVRMGNTKADITGNINRIPAQPTVDLQIKGDGVALDNLLESAYAFGFGPPPGTRASGSATADLRASGDAQAIALNGKIEIRDLKFQNASMPQPVTVTELKLDCNPEQIAAAPFRAALSRTTVDLSNLKISSYSKEPRAHLDVATSNAQLDDLVKIAESFGARSPVAASGGTASLKASIDTNLNAAASGMKISGAGKLSNARLQMSQAAKPIEVANSDLGFTGDSLRVDNLAAQFGASQLNGWLQVKDFDRPLVSFDLKSNQINLAELQQMTASGSGAQAKSSGTSSMRADGQIAIGKLVMDTLTATDVQSKVKMANGLLTLDPMTLKLYGGAYQGSLAIDTSGGGASPEIALRGNFNGLDINQFLSASGPKSSIHGRANGSINVRGRAGNAQEDLAKSLAGNGAIAISDGQFASFDLMKQVETLGKSFNLPTGGAGTAFRSLQTNLVFERGRMRTDTLQIVMDDLQVSGNGAIQLGDAPAVDYEVLARLSPELSKRVMSQSGGGVGKLLPGIEKVSSAFGNFFLDRDAMVIPIRVSGPIKQPSFGLNSEVLQKQAKAKLTERLIEGLSKDSGKEAEKETDKETSKEPAKPKPADLLKGVLEGLGRKKKP
jgi:AsmA protein